MLLIVTEWYPWKGYVLLVVIEWYPWKGYVLLIVIECVLED